MAGAKAQGAFDVAVKALGRRERTRAALRQLLERKGFPEVEVAQALERLEGLGYLDEQRALTAKARAALGPGRGLAGVVARLVAEGADEGAAADAVGAAGQELGHSDEAAARALLRKRRVTGAKAARLLAARGFDEGLIRALVPGLDPE